MFIFLSALVVLLIILVPSDCLVCNWDALGALGLLESNFWIAILLMFEACNGGGAYFLTKVGSSTAGGLYTTPGLL